MIRFSLVASAAVVAFALSACTPATESPALSEEETESPWVSFLLLSVCSGR